MDRGLPNFLSGELMWAATHLANLTPHSALDMATAYKALFGKADLSRLGTTGARAFVHVETSTKKLDDKAWEGRLCGYNRDTKAYLIYNHATHKPAESKNEIFVETPLQRASPPGGYYFQCEGPVWGSGTIMADDNLLREVRDLI